MDVGGNTLKTLDHKPPVYTTYALPESQKELKKKAQERPKVPLNHLGCGSLLAIDWRRLPQAVAVVQGKAYKQKVFWKVFSRERGYVHEGEPGIDAVVMQAVTISAISLPEELRDWTKVGSTSVASCWLDFRA